MRKNYLVCALSAVCIIAFFFLLNRYGDDHEEKVIRVGYIYVGDASTAYTKNYIKAQLAIEEIYGDNVINIAKYNIAEGSEDEAIQELINEKCDIIFGASFGYGESMKEAAKAHPEIRFCHATGVLDAEARKIPNYHTFMGHIYEGRYITGVVAGMKLQEMIDEGIITAEEAKLGYVAAFPYAEVISGYTAFFLGAKNYCPSATMDVMYTNSWSDYMTEKKYAEQLIEEGCIIIGQHSDTAGPAVACERAKEDHPVYNISYNQSMVGVAPTSSLVGCRINWEPYMTAVVGAVLKGKNIESVFTNGVKINGTDAGAGFVQDWVEMTELNTIIAAPGTQEEINKCIEDFRKGTISVFAGDYVGVDPFDPADTYNLQTEFKENATLSAPAFHYVLQDVIHIIDAEE